MSQAPAPSNMPPGDSGPTGFLNGIVKAFLASNISLVLILLAAAIGLASLMLTPREEDPQIVVPLADIHVSFPGHSALETERLVVTPLEKLLYHIDGVEYVYAQAMRDRAIITVRFYVGEDRERSLVKLFKRMDEHADIVPPGVTNWIIKPVEIDDVPVVTLTLTSETSDSHALRRVGDEVVERLAGTKNLSRAWVVGGEPRVVRIQPDLDQLAARGMTPVDLRQALEAANVTASIGDLRRLDERFDAIVDGAYVRADELRDLVIGVHREQPIYVKDVATIIDGPDEPSTYVRHGWGPARGHLHDDAMAGAVIGGDAHPADGPSDGSDPAVTIALAKKKGTNAVWVARDIITAAEELKREVIPDDVSMVITRNYGVTADHKVNELSKGLIVAIIIVIGLSAVASGGASRSSSPPPCRSRSR
jgi:multidrug efflux pump subunit AcrB